MIARRFVALAIAGAFAIGAGCSTDDDTDDNGPDDTAPAVEEGRGGPEVADVSELADELGDAGFTCDLEYEGLVDDTGQREMSRCTIADDQATLTVWFDTELLDAFVDSDPQGPGATAVGPNWSIDTTDGATAAEIASALGAISVGE